MVKDGLQYGYKSLSDAISPFAMDSYLQSIDTVKGDEAVIEYEDDDPMGSEIFVLHNDKSVQFTIDIVNYVANEQTDTASIFTEAALYFHGRIFSMKTFKAKVKDDSVLLRIIWTINF